MQGWRLQRYCLTRFIEISSQVEEEVLINSSIIGKNNLLAQLLLREPKKSEPSSQKCIESQAQVKNGATGK